MGAFSLSLGGTDATPAFDLSDATSLPIATGLAVGTSANLAGRISDETGSGALVFATSPTLVTPALGTPASGVLTNVTGYPGDSSLVTAGVVTTGTWASNRNFEQSAGTPAGSTGGADIVVEFGDNVATTVGDIYYYTTSASWALANAEAAETSIGLLAVALNENSSDGMLLRGTVTLNTLAQSTGLPIYLSTVAGDATVTIPSDTGNIVRVLGYSLNDDRALTWFNPDNAWVELS